MKRSAIARQHISESLKGHTAWNKGIPRTAEEKQKMYEGKAKTKPIRMITWGMKALEPKEIVTKQPKIRMKSGPKLGHIPWNRGIPRDEATKQKIRDTKARNNQTILSRHLCKVCETVFFRRPCYARRGDALTYCSRKCYSRDRREYPRKGKPRPELAERNRQGRLLNPTQAKELLQAYQNYPTGLRPFSKDIGMSMTCLKNAWKRWCYVEYISISEVKWGLRKYNLGEDFERYVQTEYQNMGYHAVRTPASRGPFDVVAIKGNDVLLIQCKTNGYLPLKKRGKLVALANSISAKAFLATRNLLKGIPLIMTQLNVDEEIREK